MNGCPINKMQWKHAFEDFFYLDMAEERITRRNTNNNFKIEMKRKKKNIRIT